MKIIILGCHAIGKALATQLSREGHDITLVDEDNDRLLALQEHVDLQIICGKPTYPDVLESADAENSDIIIAVTPSDEENLLACQIANTLFHIKIKIACIRSHNYIINSNLFGNNGLPINVFINPAYLIADEIYQLISHAGCLQVLDFCGDRLKLASAPVSADSKFIHKSAPTLQRHLGNQTKIVAVYRQDELIFPGVKSALMPGDEVYHITPAAELDQATSLIKGKSVTYRQIMVAGGNQASTYLIERLQHQYEIKLIDADVTICHEFAKRFPSITVLHGDLADSQLLREENIAHVDLFIALTEDDEDNLVASLQAKHMGAKHVISQIDRLNYLNVIERSGVDIALSPRQMVVDSIFAYVHQGDYVKAYSLPHSNAEVIEIILLASTHQSSVINQTIDDLNLPKQATICALIRNDHPIPVTGKTKLQLNDHLIIFLTNKSYIRAVEQLFY